MTSSGPCHPQCPVVLCLQGGRGDKRRPGPWCWSSSTAQAKAKVAARFHCPWPRAGGGRWGRPPQLGMLKLFFFSRFRSVTISASLLQRGKKKKIPRPTPSPEPAPEPGSSSARSRPEPSPAQPSPAPSRAHPARAVAMEDPEPAGAAPAPGLSSLLPSRELLRSRKGQLLLAESVRTGHRGRGAAGAIAGAAGTRAGSAGPTRPGPLPVRLSGERSAAEGKQPRGKVGNNNRGEN